LGQALEGEPVFSIKFYYDDAVPDGSALIDDIEVLE